MSTQPQQSIEPQCRSCMMLRSIIKWRICNICEILFVSVVFQFAKNFCRHSDETSLFWSREMLLKLQWRHFRTYDVIFTNVNCCSQQIQKYNIVRDFFSIKNRVDEYTERCMQSQKSVWYTSQGKVSVSLPCNDQTLK